MAHEVKRNDKSGGGVGTAIVGLLILLLVLGFVGGRSMLRSLDSRMGAIADEVRLNATQQNQTLRELMAQTQQVGQRIERLDLQLRSETTPDSAALSSAQQESLETVREAVREATREVMEQTARDVIRDAAGEAALVAAREAAQETVDRAAEVVARQVAQEVSREVAHEAAREAAILAARQVAREIALQFDAGAATPVLAPVEMSETDAIMYRVRRGETLWDISASLTGTALNYTVLMEYNNLESPPRLQTGQRIYIPTYLLDKVGQETF